MLALEAPEHDGRRRERAGRHSEHLGARRASASVGAPWRHRRYAGGRWPRLCGAACEGVSGAHPDQAYSDGSDRTVSAGDSLQYAAADHGRQSRGFRPVVSAGSDDAHADQRHVEFIWRHQESGTAFPVAEIRRRLRTGDQRNDLVRRYRAAVPGISGAVRFQRRLGRTLDSAVRPPRFSLAGAASGGRPHRQGQIPPRKSSRRSRIASACSTTPTGW